MTNRRDVTCPGCGIESSILHGNKVMCGCGTTYGVSERGECYMINHRPKPKKQVVGTRFAADPHFLDNPPEGSMATRPSVVIRRSVTEAMAETMKVTRQMFNYTTPNEKTVDYFIEERDGVFVIFSKAYPIRKDGTGVAVNFVAEKDSMESAEDLVSRLKKL